MLLKFYIASCIFAILSVFGVRNTLKRKMKAKYPTWQPKKSEYSLLHRICLGAVCCCMPIINVIYIFATLFCTDMLFVEMEKKYSDSIEVIE